MEITRHAYERARERLGLKPSALRKLAAKALASGVTIDKTRGRLFKYLTENKERYGTDNIRIYGEFIYMFLGEKLITVYFVPNEFKHYIHKLHLKLAS